LSVLLSVPVAVVVLSSATMGEVSPRRLRADRPRHADRVGGQERHSHREFAKDAFQRGESRWTQPSRSGAASVRPILMTSFAFILGCVPLWNRARCRGGRPPHLGTTVISGMLAATGSRSPHPVLFVAVQRLSGAERRTGDSAGRGSAPAEA